jgi:ribonuclease VapC
MVIDSSAVLAILKQESAAARCALAIANDSVRLMSAASLVEAGMVMQARFGDGGARGLDALLRRAQIEIAPFDAEQVAIARDAFRRFGKGRHPAGLNLGDCFAYALAKRRGEPLLFVGDDFGRTDLAAALSR